MHAPTRLIDGGRTPSPNADSIHEAKLTTQATPCLHATFPQPIKVFGELRTLTEERKRGATLYKTRRIADI